MDEREQGERGVQEAPRTAAAPPPVPGAVRSSGARRRRRPSIDAGTMVGTTFRLWARSLPTWLALTGIVFAPYIALVAWMDTLDLTDEETILWTGADQLVHAIFANLLTGAVVYGVFRHLRGQRPSLGETLSRGLRRMPVVLVVALLQGLCYVLPFLPGLGIAFVMESPLVGGLLAALAVIPAVIVLCGLFVAIPVAVVERPGVFASLRRSWELTRGSRGSVFGAWILFTICIAIVAGVFTAVAMLALDWSELWPGVLVALFGTSLSAILVAVVYHDLRANKEGLGEDELAAIFD